MKKILYAVFVLIILSSCGCARAKHAIKPGTGLSAAPIVLPHYSGRKAKIYLADFIREQAETDDKGIEALRQKLVETLTKSSRFSVIEHPQVTDLIINIVIREFEPEDSGGRSGIGGGGGGGRGLWGGLLGSSFNKARIALDISIVNASNLRTIAASKVQAQAEDTEKAMRTCIVDAVIYIAEAIPANYYRY